MGNIREVVKRIYGGAYGVRGRLFAICVTGEEVLVLCDGRKATAVFPESFANVVVPTICQSCAGVEGSARSMAVGMDLHENLVGGWSAVAAVEEWCGGRVEVMVEVTSREVIMEECRRYGARVQGAEIEERGGGRRRLRMLPYFNTAFV